MHGRETIHVHAEFNHTIGVVRDERRLCLRVGCAELHLPSASSLKRHDTCDRTARHRCISRSAFVSNRASLWTNTRRPACGCHTRSTASQRTIALKINCRFHLQTAHCRRSTRATCRDGPPRQFLTPRSNASLRISGAKRVSRCRRSTRQYHAPILSAPQAIRVATLATPNQPRRGKSSNCVSCLWAISGDRNSSRSRSARRFADGKRAYSSIRRRVLSALRTNQ